MANCCICGRKIGGWGEDKYVFDSRKEIMSCYKCSQLIRNVINSENDGAYQTNFKELDNTMTLYNIPFDTREIIESKLKEALAERGIMSNLKNLCPICGAAVLKEQDACLQCGYQYQEIKYIRPSSQTAEIYNNRKAQLLKNPMYEYQIETVMDSAVIGKFDADLVQQTITRYAIAGWRLHTAFTNEAGKNAVLGINATIDQTVLIFERCIKAEEN